MFGYGINLTLALSGKGFSNLLRLDIQIEIHPILPFGKEHDTYHRQTGISFLMTFSPVSKLHHNPLFMQTIFCIEHDNGTSHHHNW